MSKVPSDIPQSSLGKVRARKSNVGSSLLSAFAENYAGAACVCACLDKDPSLHPFI